MAGAETREGFEPTWHESLLGYCGDDVARRDAAEAGMRVLGRRCGVELDYGVRTNWQPVDSQRAMLWARRFGLAEDFMDALGHAHFERRESASHRPTLVAAARDAGLDGDALARFLDTKELVDDVWASFGGTIRDKGIHAIPYFVFGPPGVRTPFRDAGVLAAETVNGSGDPAAFLAVFEALLARALPERLGTLSVRALKRALAERRVDATGCAEKGDLVALLAAADARLLAASP